MESEYKKSAAFEKAYIVLRIKNGLQGKSSRIF